MTTYKEAVIARHNRQRPMIQFEFHLYKGNDCGSHVIEPDVMFYQLSSDSAARKKAGRLARTISGPVDIAFAGAGEWSDRYITTASPSDFHAAGYRFERLD